MMIKIKDVIDFYTDKMKNDPDSMSWKWMFLIIMMLTYIGKENEEIDIAEIEKFIPNIKEEMGIEE